jgi:hypothetical protein
MNFLKLVLDILPFNKSKTKLGVLLGIAAILQQFVPGVDLPALVNQLLTEHLSVSAILVILTGVIHKVLKGDVDSDENL